MTKKTLAKNATELADARNKSSKQHQQSQDAIDQLFVLLDIAYPSLFARYYSDQERLAATKKLWHHHLQQIPTEVIMKAANHYIANNRYLPSINDLRLACLEAQAVPSLQQAWYQAINLAATSGLSLDDHDINPVIHHAARATGWEALRDGDSDIFDIFSYHYQLLCKRMLDGERLDAPIMPALKKPPPVERALSLKRLKKMRQALRL